MEVVLKYDTEFEDWKLENYLKFKGTNTENLIHEFGISPQDPNEPDCCYFNVGLQKIIDNAENGRVFTAKATTTFKVRNNNEIPSVEFCFDLLDSGTFEFAKIFNIKKNGTYISDKKIPIPQIENFKVELETAINFWVRNIRNTGIN